MQHARLFWGTRDFKNSKCQTSPSFCVQYLRKHNEKMVANNIQQNPLKYNEDYVKMLSRNLIKHEDINNKKNNIFCEDKFGKDNYTSSHPDLIKIKDTMSKKISGEDEYVVTDKKISAPRF